MYPRLLSDMTVEGDRFHLVGAPAITYETIKSLPDEGGMVNLRAAVLYPDGTEDSIQRQLFLPAATHVLAARRRRLLTVPCLECQVGQRIEWDTAQPAPLGVLCEACDTPATAETRPAYGRPYWITAHDNPAPRETPGSIAAAVLAITVLAAREPAGIWELWVVRPAAPGVPRRWEQLAKAVNGSVAPTVRGRTHLAAVEPVATG
ncbi:hypothetical protein [Kitasatospora sp. NPDC085464]|uniref:hypothetical protein n=1 Tax=Kitasatospora sp. NPDC085464 TaxID=3364063 RepID=UPI0037C695A0